MSKRCILLAGPPDVDTLNWDDQSLLSAIESPVERFLKNVPKQPVRPSQLPTPTGPTAKWRTLPNKGGSEPGSMPVEYDDEQTQFLSFEREAGVHEKKQRLRFLEHSMAVLDDLDSSLIAPQADDTEGVDQTTFLSVTSLATTSFRTSISSDSLDRESPAQNGADPVQLKAIASITDLKRIPNANHITRIQPQTITINLVVGVIAVLPSRTVRLKRLNAQMDIIELTVGDDTRAGFPISLWLVPIDGQ